MERKVIRLFVLFEIMVDNKYFSKKWSAVSLFCNHLSILGLMDHVRSSEFFKITVNSFDNFSILCVNFRFQIEIT